uniref:F-box domain-containing protein n=1 Tax=Globodera rostochiensis TaxID=31243 RepID=A0A914HFL8_GLORO
MSDNVSDEEQQQQMEELFICADIWLEVFAFLDPVKLGLKMALISDRFDVLVDEHFKLRKWSLSWLQIRRAIGGNGAQIVNRRSGELLPIPQGPLPDKVIGFEQIQISYVDKTVIEFLQRIRRLFDSAETNVYLATLTISDDSLEIVWQKIWPFVSDNIWGFLDYFVLDNFRKFSPTVLRNCAKLRRIFSFGLFPEFPAEDNADASSGQALAKWLITAREDDRPKTLRCVFSSTGMEGLKAAFVNASEQVNFIIKCWAYDGEVVPFELENNWTGERLTLRQMDERWWLLVRCPIVREEDKWAKWEEEAIEWGSLSGWNLISIGFDDWDIGDGMLDENDDGPSEPRK